MKHLKTYEQKYSSTYGGPSTIMITHGDKVRMDITDVIQYMSDVEEKVYKGWVTVQSVSGKNFSVEEVSNRMYTFDRITSYISEEDWEKYGKDITDLKLI